MHWNKLDHALEGARGASGGTRRMIDTERTLLDVLQGFVQELRAAFKPLR